MVNKVIWSEGALLSQQHLQQFEKSLFNEHYVDRQLKEKWGVTHCDCDRGSLENGIYKVLKLKALLPDYRWIAYDMDESDVSLSFALTEEHESIYLIFPRGNKTSHISEYPVIDKRDCAFVGFYEVLKDDNDPKRQSEVLLGRNNICLSNKHNKQIDCSVIKLAELKRTQGQCYKILDTYIPPMLSVSTFVQGLRFVNSVLQRLKETEHQLQSHNALGDNIDFFSLKSLLSRYEFVFAHILYTKKASPQHIYKMMHQLCYELSAFSLTHIERHYIPYDHYDLFQTFSSVTSEIKRIVDTLVIQKEMGFAFQRKETGIFFLEEIPKEVKNSTVIYLLISGISPSDRAILSVKNDIKVSSINEIERLRQCALSGLKLKQITSSNRKAHAHLGDLLVEIDTSTSHWQKVLSMGNIAVQYNLDDANIVMKLIIEKA